MYPNFPLFLSEKQLRAQNICGHSAATAKIQYSNRSLRISGRPNPELPTFKRLAMQKGKNNFNY